MSAPRSKMEAPTQREGPGLVGTVVQTDKKKNYAVKLLEVCTHTQGEGEVTFFLASFLVNLNSHVKLINSTSAHNN